MTKIIEIVPQLPPIGLGHVLNGMSLLCKNRYMPQENDWFTAKQIRDSFYTSVVRPIDSQEELSRFFYRSNGRSVSPNFLDQYPKGKQTAHDPEWFWQPQVKRIEDFLIPEMQIVLPDNRDELFPNLEMYSLIYDYFAKISDAERRAGNDDPIFWQQRWYNFSTREKEKCLREAGGALFDIQDGPVKKYRPTSLGHKYGSSFWNIGPEMYYIYLKPIKVEAPE